MYSKDGKLLAEYAIEKRIFVPIDAVPKTVINSFLSAEDKNFFDHPGVDAKGILRAIVNNIKNIAGNKRPEGASTITQQVAKNFLLTNEVSIKKENQRGYFSFQDRKSLQKKNIRTLFKSNLFRPRHIWRCCSKFGIFR